MAPCQRRASITPAQTLGPENLAGTVDSCCPLVKGSGESTVEVRRTDREWTWDFPGKMGIGLVFPRGRHSVAL